MLKRTNVFFLILVGAGILIRCGGTAPPAGPGNPTPTPTAAADIVITINGVNGGMSFFPAAVTAKVGQTVVWRNSDSTTHDVRDNAGAFDTGSINANSTSLAMTLATAGTFAYHCTIHPSMTGTLTVTP